MRFRFMYGELPCRLGVFRLKAKAGEVTEWLKVHAWNACVRKYREFESHPLRQKFDLGVIARSCATKNHEPRQVREEAAAVKLFVCRGCLAILFLGRCKMNYTLPGSAYSIILYTYS